MSWSVSASGTREEVEKKLEDDFRGPLNYLTGAEKGICRVAQTVIFQTLTGYEGQNVSVSANGHAGVNGEIKYQTLNISIQPAQ